jgi:hypothetical protein
VRTFPLYFGGFGLSARYDWGTNKDGPSRCANTKDWGLADYVGVDW